MRTTDDYHTTLTLGPVKQQDQTVSVRIQLDLDFRLPDQDAQLTAAIEAHVHHAGLELQRALFRALIEHADKTVFGTVEAQRLRVTHRGDGAGEVPSATAWQTAHRSELTRRLREAVCDQMLDESAGATRQDVGEAAGEPDLVCRSTVLNIVHEEGAALLGALHGRAEEALETPSRSPGSVDAATGPPVVVEPDEVKVKAQPHTGRKEVWLFTAVARLAGWCHLLLDAMQEGLTRQLAALLHRLGVLTGRRPLTVLADGAGWIRAWFEALAVPGKLMVLCWYHLRKRCYQKTSGSGLSQVYRTISAVNP